ncbi:MAG TPA: type IV pilus secretin PilQ, partial [Bdellovibrionales bacterium]|nr:type IV pilus secretin PilQ [Bdellovibrionales bacterium]
PVTYQTRMNAATRQFVIEIADAELPPGLQRPYNVGNSSAIGGINAYQGAGSSTARIVIQLAGGGAEPAVQQEGTSLVIVPSSAPALADASPQIPAPGDSAPVPSADATQPLAAKTLDEFLTGNQRFYGRNISLQVKDADVRDVVNFLAEESGANVVISDDVSGKISLKLRRIPWDQALVTVMRTKNLGYVRQGNVLRISTLKALQEETETATKILEAQKAIVPAIVQVIPISYADLDELSRNVTPFLAKDGRVVADKRTSTLIITDRGDVVDRVRRLVKTLDVPPAQVSIESKIVEAVEAFETFIGVNWGFTGAKTNLSKTGGYNNAPIDLNPALRITSIDAASATANPLSANLNIGVLDALGNLSAALSLAERDQLAKVISSPRISAMNREKSTIRQEGENVTIIQTRSDQTGSITRTEKRTPFALELNVTPQITADGGVIMELDVKREFLGALIDTETGARPVNKRFAKTKVMVKNGQTAVIGGIYTSDEAEGTNGVPGLKDIPVLGWLFKSKTFSRTKNELLIFLTPRSLQADPIATMAAASPNGAVDPSDDEF